MELSLSSAHAQSATPDRSGRDQIDQAAAHHDLRVPTIIAEIGSGLLPFSEARLS